MSIEIRVPRSVATAAERGLRLRRLYGRGGTSVGLATARRLAGNAWVPYRFVRKVSQYFPRHQYDNLKVQRGKPVSNGRIAWLLWGGDAGWRWSAAVVRREEGLPKR